LIKDFIKNASVTIVLLEAYHCRQGGQIPAAFFCTLKACEGSLCWFTPPTFVDLGSILVHMSSIESPVPPV